MSDGLEKLGSWCESVFNAADGRVLPHFLNTSDVRFSFRNNGAHPNRVDDVVHRYRDQNKRNRYDRSSEDPLREVGECASQTFCLVFL